MKNSHIIDWDETINDVISKCNKLEQNNYKTRNDRVGKGILWELYKKLKFDNTKKLYMQKPESVLEKAHNSLGFWDKNISPNPGQKTRSRNNQQQKKKRICRIQHFTNSADHRVKTKEIEKRDKIIDFTWEL